jgi:hypothetical protein
MERLREMGTDRPPDKVIEILKKGNAKVSMCLVEVPADEGDDIAYGEDMMEVISCEKDGDVYFVYGYLHSFKGAIPQ